MTTVDPVAVPGDAQRAPLLALRALAVRYEGEQADAVGPVSAEIAPGEVVLLLGPSGSGKSTLTLALNGLIPQSVPARLSGAVEVAGLATDAVPVSVLSQHVAMVFQDPDAQLVTGTVLDEVAFALENLRMPVPELMGRAEQALRRVGLWERRAENPDRLSGGGKQRLAIACALAMGSPLLVLDEPTANLDSAGVDDVYAALRELVAAGDRAVVLVEHNLDAAIGLADRVLVLDHKGALACDGTVDAVLRGQAEHLHEMGVWLPTATLAALRLRRAGYRLDPLPLTPAELHAALAAASPPPPTPHRLATPFCDGTPEFLAPSQGSVAEADGEGSRAEDDGAALRPQGQDAAGQDTAPRAARSARAAAPRAPHADPLIAVRSLTVTRGHRTLLHDVDLDVQAGDFVAVVGANGAGKTTLVQAIAGVVRPPRGRIRVNGLDPHRARPHQLAAQVGFVFQNPEHQFIAHTVFDELAHGLRLRRTPEAEVRERVSRMLQRFGLADRAQTHPFLLSGGQKRRLSVGTALIAGAPVLVLDEPTFGQDRASADELLHLLQELNRDGTTVIIVTHDPQLVVEHAGTTAVLSDGQVVASGPTSRIFGDPQLLAAAGLRMPPLHAAFAHLPGHPALQGIVRLHDLPGGRS